MLIGELLEDLPHYKLAKGDMLVVQPNYANLREYIVMSRVGDNFVPTGPSASGPSASAACVVPTSVVELTGNGFGGLAVKNAKRASKGQRGRA